MSIDELRSNSAFLEHWTYCEGPILEYLSRRLIASAKSAKCGEQSQAESAENRTLAMLIAELETLTTEKKPILKSPRLRPLHSMTAAPNKSEA